MRIIKILLLASFFLFLFSISFTTSYDFNQDLGRHIKLGEIILQTKSVPNTNLFSYTNPKFPFFNHHWLSEIIYFVLHQINPNLLIFLKVALFIGSVSFVMRLSLSKAGLVSTFASAILFAPLFLERMDIRPETFGYLFFAILLYILFSRTNKKLFYVIPFIMFLWINLHITFVFGLFLTGLIFIKLFFEDKKSFWKDTYVRNLGLALFIALLLNPNHIQGLLYPFNIFRNYGYSIVENQNLIFLSKITFNPIIPYFFKLSPLVIISLIMFLTRKKIFEFIVLSIFFVLAWYQIRHMPFFTLAAIPLVAYGLSMFTAMLIPKMKEYMNLLSKDFNTQNFDNKILLIQYLVGIFLIFVNITFGIMFMNNAYFYAFDKQERFGLAVHEEGKNAMEFIKKNKLPQPIFNNFDIGGYAIYKLYPEYKVFVDNRPEAYPAQFMQGVYVNGQQNPLLREQMLTQYNIKTIVMNHTDQTPWAAEFMQDLLNNPEWKLVFTDSYIIVLTKTTNLPDLKNNNDYFKKIINSEENYLNLLKISRIFSMMKKSDLVGLTMNKALQLNPYSCSINKFLYNQAKNDLINFDAADQIKKKAWYCF